MKRILAMIVLVLLVIVAIVCKMPGKLLVSCGDTLLEFGGWLIERYKLDPAARG